MRAPRSHGPWRSGRAVECGGLENRWAARPSREFESLLLRHDYLAGQETGLLFHAPDSRGRDSNSRGRGVPAASRGPSTRDIESLPFPTVLRAQGRRLTAEPSQNRRWMNFQARPYPSIRLKTIGKCNDSPDRAGMGLGRQRFVVSRTPGAGVFLRPKHAPEAASHQKSRPHAKWLRTSSGPMPGAAPCHKRLHAISGSMP